MSDVDPKQRLAYRLLAREVRAPTAARSSMLRTLPRVSRRAALAGLLGALLSASSSARADLCTRVEACVDGSDYFGLVSGNLQHTHRNFAQVGSYSGCSGMSASSGVSLYSPTGVWVLDGVPVVAGGSRAVTLPALSYVRIRTARGSVALASTNQALADDDGPSGASLYDFDLCFRCGTASDCPTNQQCATSGANTGNCVQCLSNAHCAGATPVCNTATNACRACAVPTQASDCPAAGTVCNGRSGACEAPYATVDTPADGSNISNPRPPLLGTATPGQTVTVTLDGAPLGTAVADSSGHWSLPYPASAPTLTNGTHTARASAAGATSPTSTFSLGCVSNLDCPSATPVCEPTLLRCVQCASNADCPGATPVCDRSAYRCRSCTVATQATDCPLPGTACDDAASACVATMVALLTPAEGAYSTDPRPAFTGTGTPGQTVTIVVDGRVLGTATVDSAGRWSFPYPSGSAPLAPGAHTVTARLGLSTSRLGNFTIGCRDAADCSGTTPLCDLFTSQCRACIPTDCVGATPLCDGTSGRCIAPPLDAGADARVDASSDASSEANLDATLDATMDASPESATLDARADSALSEVATDAPADASGAEPTPEAGPEAALPADAGEDASAPESGSADTGSAGSDSGAPGARSGSGCGCRAPSSSGARAQGLAVLLALAGATLARRRRATAPRGAGGTRP